MSLPDMHEHTCDNCKGVFYTEWFPMLPAQITDPQFCPFCGIKFNYKRKTEGVKV
jgi:ribosomal protein L37AE/L43A